MGYMHKIWKFKKKKKNSATVDLKIFTLFEQKLKTNEKTTRSSLRASAFHLFHLEPVLKSRAWKKNTIFPEIMNIIYSNVFFFSNVNL